MVEIFLQTTFSQKKNKQIQPISSIGVKARLLKELNEESGNKESSQKFKKFAGIYSSSSSMLLNLCMIIKEQLVEIDVLAMAEGLSMDILVKTRNLKVHVGRGMREFTPQSENLYVTRIGIDREVRRAA